MPNLRVGNIETIWDPRNGKVFERSGKLLLQIHVEDATFIPAKKLPQR